METFLSYDVLGLGIVTGYQLLIIVHLFGLAIGAGAAFFSDFLFVDIMKDKVIDSKEHQILMLTTKVVWLGLSIIIVSGLLIFLGAPERLLESSKFLAKMTIVGILTANGVLFHVLHLPMLKNAINKNLSSSQEFVDKSTSFFISGAVSGVSWASAIILGSISSIDYNYLTIMGVYLLLVSGAVATSFLVRQRILS